MVFGVAETKGKRELSYFPREQRLAGTCLL